MRRGSVKAKADGGGPSARRGLARSYILNNPIVPNSAQNVKPQFYDLLAQADARARQAGLAWRTAKELGRPLSEICFYRRRQLAHQSVWWAVRRAVLERAES